MLLCCLKSVHAYFGTWILEYWFLWLLPHTWWLITITLRARNTGQGVGFFEWMNKRQLVFACSPGQCALLGSRKCTYGPSYWCSHIHHAKECNAVQHCMTTVWKNQHDGMTGSVSVWVGDDVCSCVYVSVSVCLSQSITVSVMLCVHVCVFMNERVRWRESDGFLSCIVLSNNCLLPS